MQPRPDGELVVVGYPLMHRPAGAADVDGDVDVDVDLGFEVDVVGVVVVVVWVVLATVVVLVVETWSTVVEEGAGTVVDVTSAVSAASSAMSSSAHAPMMANIPAGTRSTRSASPHSAATGGF